MKSYTNTQSGNCARTADTTRETRSSRSLTLGQTALKKQTGELVLQVSKNTGKQDGAGLALGGKQVHTPPCLEPMWDKSTVSVSKSTELQYDRSSTPMSADPLRTLLILYVY